MREFSATWKPSSQQKIEESPDAEPNSSAAAHGMALNGGKPHFRCGTCGKTFDTRIVVRKNCGIHITAGGSRKVWIKSLKTFFFNALLSVSTMTKLQVVNSAATSLKTSQ